MVDFALTIKELVALWHWIDYSTCEHKDKDITPRSPGKTEVGVRIERENAQRQSLKKKKKKKKKDERGELPCNQTNIRTVSKATLQWVQFFRDGMQRIRAFPGACNYDILH